MTTPPAKAGPPKDAADLSHGPVSSEPDQAVVAVRAPDPLPFPVEAPGRDLAAVEFEIPEYKALSTGEVGGLMAEGLEAYRYGERVRYDSAGKRWTFRREAHNDQFALVITVSINGYLLGEGGIGLDRIAGTEGEDALMALVQFLAEDTVKVAKQAREDQKRLRSEAEKLREAEAKAEAKAGKHEARKDEERERAEVEPGVAPEKPDDDPEPHRHRLGEELMRRRR
jgi:hypothetical protein